MDNIIQVRITFRRIQTYLTIVPRLREMVGANVLIGEVIRRDLTELAKKYNAGCTSANSIPPDFFPRYESTSDRWIDPITQVAYKINRDEPLQLLKNYGVLARDGGHFVALFQAENEAIAKEKANAFKKAAVLQLENDLKGLPYDIDITPLGSNTSTQLLPAKAEGVLDLPFFQVCQASGNGPASIRDHRRDRRLWVSEPVKQRQLAARRFFNTQQTDDIIGLLRDQLPLQHKQPAQDFETLCNNGKDYLAVIHADGNRMGDRGYRFKNNEEGRAITDPLRRTLHEERLYLSMRSAVRRSVVDALQQTFADEDNVGNYRPYQVLMLGGDDLLLVCPARYALSFVKHYAHALKHYPLLDSESDTSLPLSIGAGVAIAGHNVPFYHLHHLAESLADSAKRLFRLRHSANATDNPSVVDWMLCTNAWSDDPVALRKKTAFQQYTVNGQEETLALSAKPYVVLDEDKANINSLENILEAANTIRAGITQQSSDSSGVARSQLRQLVGELNQGRRWSELLYNELPLETAAALKPFVGEQLWQTFETHPHHWFTYLQDLIEVTEIPRLGRSN